MNSDQLAGKWQQMKGEAKTQWGKLTDDDLMTISGQKDKLIGKLQERYGYAKRRSEPPRGRVAHLRAKISTTSSPARVTSSPISTWARTFHVRSSPTSTNRSADDRKRTGGFQDDERVVFLTYAVPMALLLISFAAFLLYVPLMTAAVVGAIVVTLVLSFLLGMAAGGRRIGSRA